MFERANRSTRTAGLLLPPRVEGRASPCREQTHSRDERSRRPRPPSPSRTWTPAAGVSMPRGVTSTSRCLAGPAPPCRPTQVGGIPLDKPTSFAMTLDDLAGARLREKHQMGSRLTHEASSMAAIEIVVGTIDGWSRRSCQSVGHEGSRGVDAGTDAVATPRVSAPMTRGSCHGPSIAVRTAAASDPSGWPSWTGCPDDVEGESAERRRSVLCCGSATRDE